MAYDSNKPIKHMKICLVGDSNVGKTSIASRFIYNVFNPLTTHSIGAAYGTKEMEVENQMYRIHVWDTAGQERYSTMVPLYYRNANAVVIVYDVTSPTSFSSVKVWNKEINVYTSPDVLIAIAGNKCDLQEKRKIEKHAGKRYAKELGALYFETSAADGRNVQEMLHKIAEKVHRSSEPRMEEENTTTPIEAKKSKCVCSK